LADAVAKVFAMTDVILALDFGGTKLAAGVAARGERQWQATRRALSAPGTTAQNDRATMLALGHELLAGERPAAVGISFGGPVDYHTGLVRLSHHIPGWENVPLQQMVEAEFNAPARVDNDANVAALAEFKFGAGQGCASLLYLTVSTGVGGGWVLNGQPWRGYNNMAGEFGHMAVDPNGPMCVCGKRGCVERLASGLSIAQHARELLAAQPHRASLLRASGTLDAQQVAEAAAQGDALATEALTRAARALGLGIGNIANVVNPQRFVLGGGVTKSGPLFWNTVHETARATALPEVEFDIQPAGLGDDAPLWGAVALVENL
jgi:glucokinase